MQISQEIFLYIVGGLLTIIGFFATFLLNSIAKSQDRLNEKMSTLLSRIEVQEIEIIRNKDDIKEVKDELRNKCDKCPLNQYKADLESIWRELEAKCSKEDCPYK